MKNLAKYKKIYHKDIEDRIETFGEVFPLRTWEEVEKSNIETFQETLLKFDNGDYLNYERLRKKPALKTEFYLKFLHYIDDFGFYKTFSDLDYCGLNNVLFQTSRRLLLEQSIIHSSNDHSRLCWDIPNAFACNDFDIIESFLPRDLEANSPLAVLMMLIYYKDENLKGNVFEKVKNILACKIALWERYNLEYLVALNNRDLEAVNKCLVELCKAYQRIGYPKEKRDKCFASEVHGLYRFARVADPEFFAKITRPKHPSFSENFELWQADNNYPKGELFYIYPDELDYMNKIFAAEIPKPVLCEYKDGRKVKMRQDTDQFLLDLTRNAKQV